MATIKITIGHALSSSFVWRVKDSSPVEYVNLTGKTLRLFIKSGSRTLLTLQSGAAATALGSSLTITSAVGGAFNYRITDEETAVFRASTTHTRFYIEYEEPSGDIKMLYKWTATITKA